MTPPEPVLPELLQGERVTLRPATEADVDALVAITQEPGVVPWWGEENADGVRLELPHTLVIEVGGAMAGMLLAHEETEPMYLGVAFDISLTAALQGQGIGPEALRVAIRHYVAQGHHRFSIDPAAENARAISAYASVGFRPVGTLRCHEQAPDGRWRDGLLMDLLADELLEG